MMSGEMMIGLMINHFNIYNNCDIYIVKEIMGKVIKLKENDIQRIIKKVLKEGEEGPTINVPIKGGYLTIDKDMTKNQQNVIKVCIGGKCYRYKIQGGRFGYYSDVNFKSISQRPNGDIIIDRWVKGGDTKKLPIEKSVVYKLVDKFRVGSNISFDISTLKGDGTVLLNRV